MEKQGEGAQLRQTRLSQWAPHLQPRYLARNDDGDGRCRAATLLPGESPRASDTDSWTSEATQYTVQRRKPKYPWYLSRQSAAVALLLFLLQAVTAPLLAIASVYSLHCLFMHRVYLSECGRFKDFTITQDPFQEIAVGYTMSVLQASCVLIILIHISKSCSAFTDANSHLDMLPLSKIRRVVVRTRKFWTLVFLAAGGTASNVHMAFGQLRPMNETQPGNNTNKIYVENVGIQQWMYVVATLEKMLLVAIMCVGNYAKLSSRAPRLTKLVFYCVVLFYAVENALLFFGFSYHVTFKVLPGHSQSILAMSALRDEGGKWIRTESMIILALLVFNTMCRASFARFFFSKLFEQGKDLFHTVHNQIPLPKSSSQGNSNEVAFSCGRGQHASVLSTITE